MMVLRKMVLALVLPAVIGHAAAQDTTVRFDATPDDTTCTTVVSTNNGATGPDGVLTLRRVPASALRRNGDRAGRTNWQMVVGQATRPCMAPRVQVGFVAGANVNAAGRLINRGGARNVDIVVGNAELGSGNPDIDLRGNSGSQVVDIPPSTHWARLTYFAEYYATGPAGGGTVTTDVQYQLIYH